MSDTLEMTLWGFDGDLIGNESRLMVRLPIFKVNKDNRIGVASILPWSLESQNTIRWLSNDSKIEEIGTQIKVSTPVKVLSDDVILIAGPIFLESLKKIDDHEIKELITRFNIIQNEFAFLIVSIQESVRLSDRVGLLARQYFDLELIKNKLNNITDEARSYLIVLRETPTVLLDEILIRKLLVFKIEKNTDAYRRCLELSSIRLEKTRSELEDDVSHYTKILLEQFSEENIKNRNDLINDQLPDEIRSALINYREATGDRRLVIDKVSKQPNITVIKSNYTGFDTFENFQKKVVKKLRQYVQNRNLSSTYTKDFDTLCKIERNQKKYIFAFPMYLTMDKAQDGFFTITYGKLNKLGLMVPEGNDILSEYPETDQPTKLSDIIIESVNHGTKILCLENYSMREIVDQSVLINEIDGYTKNPASVVLTGNDFELVPLIENDKTIFLYDLGDKPKIMRDKDKAEKSVDLSASALLNREKSYNNIIATAKHYNNIIVDGIDIPVGIGFNIHMADWIVENNRWIDFKLWVYQTIVDLNLIDDLNTVGISLVEQIIKYQNQKFSTNKKSTKKTPVQD